MNRLFSYTDGNMFKKLIQFLLESRTKAYLQKHKPKVVVVAGSVGKTSTKMAIATVLGEAYRVRLHEGNHNTHLSVPLAVMGVEYPSNIRSIKEWWTVFGAINLRINQPDDAEVIVQELGADSPGDLKAFKYLQPDVAVITAVSPEHMEFFKTMDAVAKEELSVAKWSKLTVINRDDIDEGYAKFAETTNIDTYGIGEKAEYRVVIEPASPLEGRIGHLITPEWGEVPINLQLVGDHSLKAAAAAAAVGAKMGLSSQQVAIGVSKIVPTKGRMQVLRGLDETTIIDDTYNSSPLAAEAALKTLYAIESPQRIALLGSMNELGETSQEAHRKIGELCVPDKLSWVVTIGDDANNYLAPAAQKKGCQVRTFKTPNDAGTFIHGVLQPGTVVLAKGSQNGVYAEEAVKIFLHSTEDEDKLVRQTPDWLETKEKQFARFK
jgi:UDP-N-acetylmuramoyl-tripeptide--D-alanyl-D-alanine ligase